MKRSLVFDDGKAQTYFEFIYSAVLIGGLPKERTGGVETLRREARILDALDAISDRHPNPTETFANNEPARVVRFGVVLTLDVADYELIKKRIEEAPWFPKVSRDVVRTLDWLTTAVVSEG